MRNSVIELLRIVMMCFIVVHHIILAKYSGFYDLNQEYDISRVAYLSLDSFLFVGVYVFALISGYYAVKMGGGNTLLFLLLLLWIDCIFVSCLYR